MSSLADIWDDETNVENATSAKVPLFLPDDDVEMVDAQDTISNPAEQEQDDLDEMFSILNDPNPLQTIDIDEMKRKANARHKHLANGTLPKLQASTEGDSPKGEEKEKGGKKERQPIARLDENRLLGPDGFSRLIKDTRNFRVKGKGHEASDLKRLMQVYQFWTHKLYPKTQFKDTVDRIEKLCHSRRMNVSLSGWRDAAHGVYKDNENDNLEETNENEDGDETADPTSSRPPSTMGVHREATTDDDAPTRPPSSVPSSDAPEQVEDLFEGLAQSAPADGDMNEEDWFAVDELSHQQSASSAATAATISDSFEEDWDAVREWEQEQEQQRSHPPPPELDPLDDDIYV